MGDVWILSYKPGFLNEVLMLPDKYKNQVLKKIADLERDPHADGHTKKQLKHMKNKLHRLRSGDYRVFYTYDDSHVNLLALRRRDDETYDQDIDPEFLGAGDVDLDLDHPAAAQPNWDEWMQPAPVAETPLPEPITVELLEALRVPPELHPRLVEIHTQEELLACPGVPDDYLLLIDEHMFVKPVASRVDQPDLVTAASDDLFRFANGELDAFLLKLSPEQEKFVTWAVDASGPTLVKGGPGSGKSTVALFRVKEILRTLRANGVANPRILFTTYTVPLTNMSEQLLRTLLGEDDLRTVDVRNYDKLVSEILRGAGRKVRIARSRDERAAFTEAFRSASFSGTPEEQAAQRSSLDKLGADYVFEEILTVIQARDLKGLKEYATAARPGRRIPLTAAQRTAVWSVHEAFQGRLARKGLRTWQGVRSEAAELVMEGRSPIDTYDAVVIDEAQDLDPTVLRMLVGLCAQPNRLFVTADAQQAIYRSGFNWSDVHETLRFAGRTGILRANHRSTKQIAEAASSYLAFGAEEELEVEAQTYVHDGPLPATRAVAGQGAEVELLSNYLTTAARELRLTMGSCAVLVPTNDSGQQLAEALSTAGVAAVFQESHAVDITAKEVKVLTLAASKGLEFPIVAIAGLRNEKYPYVPTGAPVQSVMEILAKERRTLFVAMTRAMRALLVLTPSDSDSTLFEGFDPDLWNVAP